MQIAAAAAFGFREREIMPRGFQVRVNLQCSTKTDRGFAKLAEREMTKPLAGCSAEMIRVPRQSLLAIEDCTLEVLAHVSDRSSLVPAFGKLRRRVNYPREK